MKINYYVNEENESVIGTASYTLEADYAFNGIPIDLLFLVDDIATSNERKKLSNTSRLTSKATASHGDEFDPEIGKNIVRDKLLIKDAERKLEKLQIIGGYLTKLQGLIAKEQENANGQMQRAYERLEKHQGE